MIDTDEIELAPVVNEDGLITLRAPLPTEEQGYESQFRGLDFGPSSPTEVGYERTNIKFIDGYAFVRPDHPALPELLRRYPEIEVVGKDPQNKVYVCPECERELTSRAALRAHMRTHETRARVAAARGQ